MKKIKELTPGGLYLIRIQSTANSTYFENEEEMELFWIRFNQVLKNYVIVKEHYLDSCGVQMIIQVREEDHIRNEYERIRKIKDKDFDIRGLDSWRILSLRMQLLLSQLVKEINRKRGCKGTRTKCRFERYIFDRKEEMIMVLNEMKESKVELDQKERKYKSDPNHFILEKSRREVFYLWNSSLCRGVAKGCERLKRLSEAIDFQRVKPLLVEKLIKNTIALHTHPIPT